MVCRFAHFSMSGPDRSKQHTLNGLLGIMVLVLRLPNFCCIVLLLCFLHGMRKTWSAAGVTEYLMLMNLSRFAPQCFTIAGLYSICFPDTVQWIWIARAMKRQELRGMTGTCSLRLTEVNGSTPSRSSRSHHLFFEYSMPSFQTPLVLLLSLLYN